MSGTEKEEESSSSTGQESEKTIQSTISTSIKAVGLALMKAQMTKLKEAVIDKESNDPQTIASAIKTKKRTASQNIKRLIQEISSSSSKNTDDFAKDERTNDIVKLEVPEDEQEEEEPNCCFTEIETIDVCSNCLQTIQEEEEGLSSRLIIVNDKEETTLNESILEVICSIFRIPNNNNNTINFCKQCKQSLITLYTAFNSFMELVKAGSFLHSELSKLEEEMAKLRKRGTRKTKEYKEILPEESEFITGDISSCSSCSSDDEDFQASPSDLAVVGLQSSSSSEDEDDDVRSYVPRKKSENKLLLGKRNLKRELNNTAKKNRKVYECTKCQKFFQSAHLRRVHSQNEHGKKNYKTKSNDDSDKTKVAKNNKSPTKFATTIVKREDLACQFCKKLFIRQDQLTEHERIHTKEKPNRCNFCDKTFSSRRGLHYHELTHSDDRKYVCSICGFRFKRLHHLQDHENTHRDNPTRPFTCESCGKNFKMKKHLNAHMSTHGDLKEHPCPICLRAFARKDNLRQHIKKVHGKDAATVLEEGETILVTEISEIPNTTTPTTIINTDSATTTTELAETVLLPEGTPLETINLDHIVYINL